MQEDDDRERDRGIFFRVHDKLRHLRDRDRYLYERISNETNGNLGILIERWCCLRNNMSMNSSFVEWYEVTFKKRKRRYLFQKFFIFLNSSYTSRNW